MGIVIFQRAFPDVGRCQNFFGGKPRNVVVENFTFGLGQVGNPLKEEMVSLLIDGVARPLRQLVDFRLGAVVGLLGGVSFFNQGREVIGTFAFL